MGLNMQFKETPINKRSLWSRKPIFNVGINDANYIVNPVINGKHIVCPFYRVWHNMIQRVYCIKYVEKYPTYYGCSIVKEWFVFSVFKAWMIKQDWQNKELDKDILIQGNKTYSPENCIFVTGDINKLLSDRKAARGLLPQGVHLNKPCTRYRSSCSVNGSNKHIGYFDTPEQAHEAYKVFKYKLIAEIAKDQSEPLKTALLNYKI